jgi:hypothetical protein
MVVRGCILERFIFWTNFNLVALASVATTLVVIDQLLIQRASTVVSVQYNHPVNVAARIAPEIPWSYTGYQSGRGADQQLMTGPMIRAFNDFNSNSNGHKLVWLHWNLCWFC